MPSTITPWDSYVAALNPPPPKPVPERLRDILPGYTITHILGAGGFATVYKAVDTDGNEVALKVPKMDDLLETLDMDVIEKFQAESEIWEKLHHENIVDILGSDTTPMPYIAMEVMDGGSLRSLLLKHELSVGEAVNIMLQVLEGLSYAHRMATVHRDIKPENILFTSEGEVKITDWGIGKYMASASLTQTVGTKGTLAFSAPEQFDKRKFGKVDWRTDIFQMGIVFYEMLTGKNPFEGQDRPEVYGNVVNVEPDPPSVSNPDVPPGLDDLIMGALEKRKKDRWDSGAVMLFQLRAVVEGEKTIKRKKTIKKKKTIKRKRRGKKGAGEKWKSKEILGSLDDALQRLEDIGVDISGLEAEMDPIRKYARLMWYSDVIEHGTRLIGTLKERIELELEKQEEERKERRKAVKKLFKECLSRRLDIEFLYDTNREAMEAYNTGDRDKADKLFRKLKNELVRIIDENDRKKEKEKNRRSLGEKSQRPLVWENSKRIINVISEIYRKKFLRTKKEIVNTVVEESANFLGMEFVKIPGENYYMGRYTVTQKQWKAVMGETPWKGENKVKEGDDYPATYISWNDCQEFARKLNRKEGVNKYRLPTEKEWEHACRAGSTIKYCFGDDERRLKEYAWYDENAWDIGEKYAHRVGQKKPNKWGLYDMHGNVWEWCEDLYKESSTRVLRGGCWFSYASDCRSADRFNDSPDSRDDHIGLRLVREVSR